MKTEAREQSEAAPGGRRWGRWAAGGSLAAALLLLLGCGTLAETFVFWTNDTALEAETVGPAWRVVHYESADGVRLRGAVLERDAGLPTLVWFHGTGDCAARNLERTGWIARHGFNLFVAEYRGYGGCEGEPSEEGLIADGRAALRAAERELKVARGELTLVGVSLGTGVASALAAEGEGRAVVLIAPYTSIQDVVSDYVPRPVARFCVPAIFDSLPRLKRATQPLLVVHGTADPGIPFAHGQRIVREVGPRARLLPLEGAGHDNHFEVEHWEQVSRELVSFLSA